MIKLTDEAVIKDRGDRISVKGSSEDALRVIIAQAKAKSWTGLKVTGSEEYLRMAAKVGAEEGYPIQGVISEIEPREYPVDVDTSELTL